MMKNTMKKHRKHIVSLALSFTLMLLSAVPAFAGTWIAGDDNTWTYLDNNGESISGWIDDEGDKYYLSEDGTRKTGWYKTKGSWYYFDEEGVLAIDQWIDNYYVDSDGKWIKTR